nr:hypothetical protein [Nostoc sp. DedQUE02]
MSLLIDEMQLLVDAMALLADVMPLLVDAMPLSYHVQLPIIKEPHPQPLPASGEGRQSTAFAGWGSSRLISNQADMISVDAMLLLADAMALQVKKLVCTP